jgi:hypothetical protein
MELEPKLKTQGIHKHSKNIGTLIRGIIPLHGINSIGITLK